MQPPWWESFERTVLQEPLLHSQNTLRAQAELSVGPRPRIIMVGIGLCGQAGLSQGLPVDVVGLLAPAEALRKSVGANAVVVLLADRHAEAVGWPFSEVAAAADRASAHLMALRDAADWPELVVLRARDLHQHPAWEHCANHLGSSLADLPSYARLQLLDVAALQHLSGGVLKLGWTLGGAGGALRDERFFDEQYLERVGDGVRFAYALAGRTLDPQRPRASPYVARCRNRRVLADSQDAAQLLATCPQAQGGLVRRHLARITRAAKEHLLSLDGSPVERLRQLQGALQPTPSHRRQGTDRLGAEPWS